MNKRPAFVYIGGSQPQAPALARLRALGLVTILVDRDPPVSSRALADHVIVSDATATQAIIESLKALAGELSIVAVYGIADYAMTSVAAVAKAFGAAGPEGLEPARFTDKALTSELLRKADLPVPELYWSGTSEQASAALQGPAASTGPAVVKITSGNNSNGVRLCKTGGRASLESAVRELAEQFPGSHLMIEEYVDGVVGNLDFLKLDDLCIPVSSTIRQLDSIDPTLCSSLVQPNPNIGPLTGPLSDTLADLGARVAGALEYRRGPFTVDVIHGTDGQLRILEVSPHFHCVSLDILRGNGDPISAYAAYLLSDPDWQRFLPPESGAQSGAFLQLFSSRRGRVVSVEGEELIRRESSVCDLAILAQPGTELRPQGSMGRSGIGVAWLVDQDPKALQALAARLDGVLDVTVEAAE